MNQEKMGIIISKLNVKSKIYNWLHKQNDYTICLITFSIILIPAISVGWFYS